MKTIVSSKGHVVLPAALRERDRVVAGDGLSKRQPVPDNDGLVDWLLACPEKNWFQPLASESDAISHSFQDTRRRRSGKVVPDFSRSNRRHALAD